MAPATIAVSKTGPFGERRPRSRSAGATAGGNRTRASALAVRLVGVLSLTSTMAGRRSASKGGNVMGAAAGVINLDILRAGVGAAQMLAQFAVAVGTATPDAADQVQNVRIAGAGAQRCAQIETVGREKTGIELSLRGQARAAAGAAKWLGHRRNEAHLAAAIVETPSLRHFALIVLRNRPHRPALMDTRGKFGRRHHQLGPPLIAIADVHELDEPHDHRRAAEAFDQVERRVVVQAPFDDGVDLDRGQTGGD